MKEFTLAVVLGFVIVVTSLALWAIFNQVFAVFVAVSLVLFYAFMALVAGAYHLGRRSLQPTNT